MSFEKKADDTLNMYVHWAGKNADVALLVKHVRECYAEIDRLEYELTAVMQLGVDKWLEGPDLELNNATRAGRAREIALQAIEKPTALLRECVEAVERWKKALKPKEIPADNGEDLAAFAGAVLALARARAFLEEK